MAVTLKPLPPREAIAAFQARGHKLEPTFSWQDMWQEDHATGYTVAKSAGFDILGDLFDAFNEELTAGGTSETFARKIRPTLQAKGWWGRQMVRDPTTGELRPAQLGSTRRLATIFDANMRVSYAAGHWASFERNKATRPFLRYVAVLDERTRPLHRARHNLVLPVDHPYWNTWAPPCGWGCRCTLQSLSQRDVDRLMREGEALFFEPPEDTFRNFTNVRTGEITRVPDGIDPGWAYNPGKAGYEATMRKPEKLFDAPPELAAAFHDDPNWLLDPVSKAFPTWFDDAAAKLASPSTVVIGALSRPVLDGLARRMIVPPSGAISIDQDAVQFIRTERGALRDQAAAIDELRRLPALIDQPKAILRGLRTGQLLYVLPAPGDATRRLVVFVEPSRVVDGRPRPNAVRSARVMDADRLMDGSIYEVLAGQV